MVAAATEVDDVHVAQPEVLKNIFCMEGGQGETSYINNSQVQFLHFGHNTLFVADVIVQHMTDLYGSRGHAPPEFCFYFSDLPSNDFNTLFCRLPDYSTAAGDGSTRRRYFGAGVPGSFYGRLFPERSINAFTSTFSLHWLSQVPREVLDKGSAAYNKGKVFVHSASEATGAAYRRQFQSDLGRFQRCRAAEMKRGGAMFLLSMCRPSADPTDQGGVRLLFGTLFEDSWADLVHEGLVDAETMDSFNVPLYAPTLDEFREAVDAAGAFKTNRLETVMGRPPVVDRPDDPGAVGRTVANMVRSLVGVLVDAHVGKAPASRGGARPGAHGGDGAPTCRMLAFACVIYHVS